MIRALILFGSLLIAGLLIIGIWCFFFNSPKKPKHKKTRLYFSLFEVIILIVSCAIGLFFAFKNTSLVMKYFLKALVYFVVIVAGIELLFQRIKDNDGIVAIINEIWSRNKNS